MADEDRRLAPARGATALLGIVFDADADAVADAVAAGSVPVRSAAESKARQPVDEAGPDVFLVAQSSESRSRSPPGSARACDVFPVLAAETTKVWHSPRGEGTCKARRREKRKGLQPDQRDEEIGTANNPADLFTKPLKLPDKRDDGGAVRQDSDRLPWWAAERLKRSVGGEQGGADGRRDAEGARGETRRDPLAGLVEQ